MLKTLFFTVFLLPFFAVSLEIKTTINETAIGPFDTLTGTIEILHDTPDKVDIESFTLEGQPLSVKLISEKSIENQTLSRFNFDISPEQEGLQALGSISVKVGDQLVKSTPVTYTVAFQTPETGLRLKAFVLGDEPFYPGERLKFVYKIYFLGDVKLAKEDLPLLDAKGFLKIGTLQVKDTQEKGYQVRTITQEVEAQSPGTFSFETSALEGLINGMEKIQTSVEPFTLTISPFPTKTRPTTFIGTGGDFLVSSKLVTSDKVMVGDKMLLHITFTGKGNLESIQLPQITCLPGINGFFTRTETPPYATIKDNSITFTMEIIPITNLKQEIPALSFSTYDSDIDQYQTIETKPIPITVTPQPLPVIPRPPTATIPYTPKKMPTISLQYETTRPPIIHTVPLSAFYLLLGIALFIGLIQIYGRAPLIKILHQKRKKSPRYYLKEAFKYELEDRQFYLLLRKAFSKQTTLSAKKFLKYLDAVRYGRLASTKEQVARQAKEALS